MSRLKELHSLGICNLVSNCFNHIRLDVSRSIYKYSRGYCCEGMTTAAAADDAGDSFPQNLSSAEHLDGGRPPGRGAAEVKMQHLMLIFPPKN